MQIFSVVKGTPDIGGKSIFRVLLLYPDLEASRRLVCESYICGNSAHLITDNNVVGGDFVIAKIYMIRGAIKFVT